MPVRLGRFEMPKRLTKEDSTATETYAKFVAEPFETGYGHTIGNSNGRGPRWARARAAITSIKVDHPPHEFTTIHDLGGGLTDPVFIRKTVLFKAHSRETQTL